MGLVAIYYIAIPILNAWNEYIFATNDILNLT